ncbi:hypothetical protein MNBD_ACTINO01-1022, partial [hydrothermal vent metagenome]
MSAVGPHQILAELAAAVSAARPVVAATVVST